MIKHSTFPNPIWILFQLMFMLAMLGVGFFTLSLTLKGLNVILILVVLFQLAVFFLLYVQLANHFTFVHVKENGIRIVQPLRLKNVFLSWDEIHGFSTSQIHFGNRGGTFKSKSFIIYSKRNTVFEIIKIYNFRFDSVLHSLKKFPIKKLGTESYDTGFWKRKYRFKQNEI